MGSRGTSQELVGNNVGNSYRSPSPEAMRLRGGAKCKAHHRDDNQSLCDGLTNYDGQWGGVIRHGYESNGEVREILHR